MLTIKSPFFSDVQILFLPFYLSVYLFQFSRLMPVTFLLTITLLSSTLAQSQEFLISKPANFETVQLCEDTLLTVYQSLGLTPTIISLPGRRALYAANTGETDAELCRIDKLSKQYPNLLKIEPALLELTIVALSIKPLTAIKAKADLNGYVLGSVRGMKAVENFFQQYSVHYVDNFTQVVKLLDDGLIDYAILTINSISRAQKKHFRQDFIIHQPPLFTHKLYHYIHRRHRAFADGLSQAIFKLRQSNKGVAPSSKVSNTQLP